MPEITNPDELVVGQTYWRVQVGTIFPMVYHGRVSRDEYISARLRREQEWPHRLGEEFYTEQFGKYEPFLYVVQGKHVIREVVDIESWTGCITDASRGLNCLFDSEADALARVETTEYKIELTQHNMMCDALDAAIDEMRWEMYDDPRLDSDGFYEHHT